jgi:hypothetical protein
MRILETDFVPIRLLPIIHLCACIVISIAGLEGWGVMFIVDLPFSILIAPLPWYNVPLPWAFGVLGTLWWYFVSVIIIKLKVREQKKSREKATGLNEVT